MCHVRRIALLLTVLALLVVFLFMIDGSLAMGPSVAQVYGGVGTYTATVTASNSVSLLTATTAMTISHVPITGLSASSDSPTFVGENTTLEAMAEWGGGWTPMDGPQSRPWAKELVDAGGAVGRWPSLVMDAAGNPHIAYNDYDPANDLKYAYHDGFGWHVETVAADDKKGAYASLALDDAGLPHIAYEYYTPVYGLEYAYHDGASWHFEVLASGEWPKGMSLVLDNADRPHIAYFADAPDEIRYAFHNGTSWQTQTIEGSGGDARVSLGIDLGGHPHVAYFLRSTGQLRYAFHDGLAWHIETVDSGLGIHAEPRLVLNADGWPCISYVDENLNELRYALYDGSAWQLESVDSGGYSGTWASLALDSQGHPHISYYREAAGDDDLLYAWSDGTAWYTQTVEGGGDAGGFSSIAVNESDQPCIAYHEGTGDDLWFTTTDVVADYAWGFGDGALGAGRVVTHTYQAVGTFTAVVTASNDSSQLTATTSITITEPQAGLALATNDSPTNLGETTMLSATAHSALVVFEDDFSTGKDWIDHSGGYIYRDGTNKRLNWQGRRDIVQSYYIPIPSVSGDVRFRFRINVDYFTGNDWIDMGLAETLSGAYGGGGVPNGLFVRTGYFGAVDRYMAPFGTYTGQSGWSNYQTYNSDTYVDYVNDTWYQVEMSLVGPVWTMSVYEDDGVTLRGRLQGTMPALHGSYNYFMLMNTGTGDWPTGWGWLDDIRVEPLAPLDPADVSFAWAFGDGDQGTGDEVGHIYPGVGEYTAVVTATKDSGQAVATSAVTIYKERYFPLTAINDSPTRLGESTTLTATAYSATPIFDDDFSTDKGWIDQSGGYIYRDAASEWLDWQARRDITQTYYIPIPAVSGDVRFRFRIKVDAWENNDWLDVGLAETLRDEYSGGGTATGVLVRTGLMGGGTGDVELYMAPVAGYTDQPGYAPYEWPDQPDTYVDYQYNKWYEVEFTLTGLAWTMTVLEDDGVTVCGELHGVMPAAHSGYNYVMIMNNGTGDWPTGEGWLDDIVIESLAPMAPGDVVYAWAFGDGAQGSGDVTSHAYPAAGSYTAMVTATSATGWEVAATQVSVYQEPIATLLASNDSPTPLGATTTLTATAFQASVAFEDDFATDKGWTDGSGGAFHRSVSNEWLDWQARRDTFQTYYIPIPATAGSVRFRFRIYVENWLNNCSIDVGLAETLTGDYGGNGNPTGLFVRTGFFGGGTPDMELYMAPFGVYTNQPGWSYYQWPNHPETYVDYLYYTWYQVEMALIGREWTMSVYEDDGVTLRGQLQGSMPAAHSSYNYFMIMNTRTGDWPTGDGWIDDVEVQALEPMSPSGVDFAWNLGDGDLGAGPLVEHTYPMVGTYTAVVTASNQLGLITATTPITVLASHLMELSEGWNLVSWPLVQATENPIETLTTQCSTCDEAWAYDAWDDADPWKEWPGDFEEADETMGLWLHATEPTTMTISGWTPVSPTIELRVGWNLVGYPSQTTRPVAEALASVAGHYTRVMALDASGASAPWEEYHVAVPAYANDLAVMSPGRGYWIYVTEDCTWTVEP